MYARIASAHKMIDYNNFSEVKNHLAWLPFHFLPGNGGLPAGEDPEGSELEKLICRPDSYVARDMLRIAMRDKGTRRALHRLGIAMHVYADTFVHQGFVGALCQANQTFNLTSGNPETDKKIQSITKKELIRKIRSDPKGTLQVALDAIKLMITQRKLPIQFIRSFLKSDPLGHAGADVYPDQPYLTWSYEDWKKNLIERNNPSLFMQAMNMMVKAMRAWQAGDESMNLDSYDGLNSADANVMETLFRQLQNPDGDARHASWLAAIERGDFSFGKERLKYIGKGNGSWKHRALGTKNAVDKMDEIFPYSPAFLTSDWKCFHDALQAHRSDVVHNILPRYGICAA